jgi:hypothetical protein
VPLFMQSSRKLTGKKHGKSKSFRFIQWSLGDVAIMIALAPPAFSAEALAKEPSPGALGEYMQARVKANDFSGTVLVARRGKILLSRGPPARMRWS